ncbi:MAG: type III PLP-dependent enzyme [Cyanobacteria bacterium REEB65]|nr:type III PLP-dependent enzyme [Cyanobacteria bacterium REEB65]
MKIGSVSAALASCDDLQTPFLLLSLEAVEAKYRQIVEGLGCDIVYYAIKANAHPRILERLVALGAGFDVASVGELALALAAGATSDRISYGNPVKKLEDIREAYRKGVRLFVADDIAEVAKIAVGAPRSRLLIRLKAHSYHSEWPLSDKFGTSPADSIALLREGRDRGLEPYGLTFHVGSQCYDPAAWSDALADCHAVFSALAEEGIALQSLNLGGGLPVANARHPVILPNFLAAIRGAVQQHWPDRQGLLVAVEPGRALVGDAGALVAAVVLRAERGDKPWLYLDAGIYHGLLEAIGGFPYSIEAPGRRGAKRSFALAGPTCDGLDVLYQAVELPGDMAEDDRLHFLHAGAYSTACATSFNGFDPPSVYFVEDIAGARKPPPSAPAETWPH